MIRIYAFFLMLLPLAALGQEPCATQVSEKQRQWLNAYLQNKGSLSSGQRSGIFIPIQFHIVGKNDGSGYYRLDYLWDLLCELNMKFAETGFYFFLHDVPNFISNDAYYAHDFYSGSAMMQQNNVADVVNCYLVGDPAGYCGYFTWYEDAVTVAKSCSNPGSTTLAHELGHYFYLPHPFTNVNGTAELVDGSNCEVGGDLFCDTRADYIDWRWPCPYTGTEVDPQGDAYHPDSSLFMSYSYDNCQSRFSTEQMDAMNSTVLNERPYLNILTPPSLSAITETPQYLYPADSASEIPNDWVELAWEPVEGAEYYNVQISYTLNFQSQPMVDQLVTGTAFTTWLYPNLLYRWRVIPVKKGNTCVPEVPVRVFSTVQGTGIAPGEATPELVIYPTLIHGSNLHVSSQAESAGTCLLKVMTLDGRIAHEEMWSRHSGSNHHEISTAGLIPGTYVVLFYSAGKVAQQKVVVQ